MTKNKDNIILKSFMGCLFAILLVSAGYFAYDQTFNFKTEVTVEKLIVDQYTIKNVGDAEVICEEEVSVRKFFTVGTIIYGCLELERENGHVKCKGSGKVCLIKSKERVRINK